MEFSIVAESGIIEEDFKVQFIQLMKNLLTIKFNQFFHRFKISDF